MRVALDPEQLFVDLPSGSLLRLDLRRSPASRSIHVLRVDADPPTLVVSEADLTADEKATVRRVLRDQAGSAATIVITTSHRPGLVAGAILDPGSACSPVAVATALAAVQVIAAWDQSGVIAVELEGHPCLRVRLRRDADRWDAAVVSPSSPDPARAAPVPTRFSATRFRSAPSADVLAQTLQAELSARLDGVRADALDDEIDHILAELAELGHALLAYPDSGGRSFYGLTEADGTGLDLCFTVDEETGDAGVSVGFCRQLLCPGCHVPMRGTGPFEVRFEGHGMAGGAPVHVAIDGPSPISLEVGGRSGTARAGAVFRCEACAFVLWTDGALRVSVR